MDLNLKRNWAAWLVVAALAGMFGVGAFKTIGVLHRGETVPIATGPFAEAAAVSMSRPDRTFTLPAALNEISGLSASSDPKVLWAVHDEQGSLFRLSATDGKVLDTISFGPPADYESVEEVDGRVFVARSDGAVLEIDLEGHKATEISPAEALGGMCDLEGIAWQASRKRLLLACKSQVPGEKEDGKSFVIHALDLGSRKVAAAPAYILTATQIDAYLKEHAGQADLKGLEGKDFGPSGLAVNPHTGEVNVLSSAGQMLVVLDAGGKVLRIHGVPREFHTQPEGIAFTADGTLFIGNEARGKTPTLQTFRGM